MIAPARALGLCVLLVGPAALAQPEARPDPVGAPDTEALRGNVLVWHDAPLYTEPADDAAVVRVAAAGVRKERVGHVVPMRVLSTRGAFVEVEPVDDGGCTWSRLETPDDLARLHLFVRRADLAPVLTRPYTKVFADGTRLALRPGVPVVGVGAAGYALSLRGTEVLAEIPSASVGYAYAADKPKGKVAMAAHEYALDAGTKVTLGDRAFVLAGWQAEAIEQRADAVLFTVEDRCATVEVAAPAKAVKEVDDDAASLALGGGGSGGSGVLDLRNEDYLPVGTALSAGSHPIAIVAKPIYLQVVGHGKTVCIDRRLRIDAAVLPPDTTDLDDKLHLCAPAAKVVHEKMRSSSSANGTTKR